MERPGQAIESGGESGGESSVVSGGIFVPLSLATTIATYLLIAVGALVRAAGAGLGCPDWPRCFGSWVPPTDASDLPAGFDISQFNVINTWLEYVNRLIGVVIGLLIFATLIAAWRRHRRQPRIFWPSVAAFLLVGFQGWLGGQVVANELDPNILTLHLIVALIIVGLLLYAHLCARVAGQSQTISAAGSDSGPRQLPVMLGRLGWLVAVLVLLQATLGTRVRGVLQAIEKTGVPRAEWLPRAWWPDLAHRQLAVIVILACGYLWWACRREARGQTEADGGSSPVEVTRRMTTWARWILILAGVQIASGLGMAYGAVPRSLQVGHLALSSLLIGAISVFLFLTYRPGARSLANPRRLRHS